jgi:phosphatidylinositol-3-phosphatase
MDRLARRRDAADRAFGLHRRRPIISRQADGPFRLGHGNGHHVAGGIPEIGYRDAGDRRQLGHPPTGQPAQAGHRDAGGPRELGHPAAGEPPQLGDYGSVVPRPDHIVVVILENEHRSSVIGSPNAPDLNKLAARGANLTHSYGLTHPSQPNYLALFSGSTHGVTSNACPRRFPRADNLGHQLRTSGFSLAGYAESLPKVGFKGCESGGYRRKHKPWVNFDNLPASVNRPFSAFPRDYRRLPIVTFVSPNMCHSMHDCSIRTGDRWMKKHLDRYARWATHHNSLLIVTFDENAGGTVKPIPTIIVGDHVRPGRSIEGTNHYTLLRTIEDAYGLPALGRAAARSPLSRIWMSWHAQRRSRHGLVTDPSD